MVFSGFTMLLVVVQWFLDVFGGFLVDFGGCTIVFGCGYSRCFDQQPTWALKQAPLCTTDKAAH